MVDFFNEYKHEVIRVVSIFVMSLATVYTLGRMLSLLKTYVQKNLVAFICIVSLNFYYTIFLLNIELTDWKVVFWDIGLYSALCILLYVLVGFKLYDRADSFLDKKIGEDTPKKGSKK